MKKLFIFAALVLGMASCQKDVDNLDVNMGGDVATISVALPADAITRAAADETDSAWSGLQNEKNESLTVTLYIFDENGVPSAEPYTQTLMENDLIANFEVRLVPDRNYRFVAWAGQVGAEDNFTLNTPINEVWNIALNNDWAAMNESRDAFTGYLDVEKFNSGKTIPTLELTRPFAKLRVITTDMEWITNNNVKPTYAEVSYQVELPSSFDAYSQDIIRTEKITNKQHSVFEIKDYTEDAYGEMTLFTDYILVPEAGVVKFILDVYEDASKAKLVTSTSFTTDIPVQRNNLTTIKGNILTDGNNINVEVKPEFGDEKEWPSESAEELAAAAMFGGEVTLTENVVLNQPLDVKSNMTINLGGNKLTGVINVNKDAKLTVNNGTIVNGEKSMSGITSNGDLTLNDVTIESARHAVRIESGNVVINGGTYKVAPISASTLYALNVGDNNTVANVTIKGGTFIGPKGTMADSGGAVAVRSGSTVTIEGGDFSGGKAKTLSANQGATLTVKGGSFDQNPSNYLATGYKVIEKNGKFAVVAEDVDNVVANKEDIGAVLKDAVSAGSTNVVVDAMGAYFNMEYALSQSNVPAGVTVTIRNANVINASKWNYADGTVIFENCTFSASVHSIHFDAGNGDVKFKNCHLYGWNAFGALNSVSFENCTLEGNGSYALIRSYANLTLTNCVINTSKANHNDAYPEGVQVISPATLTQNNVTYVAENANAFEHALADVSVKNIILGAGKFSADFYNGSVARESLTIEGTEGTQIEFLKGNVRAELFDNLTIKNCEILPMVDKWGMMTYSTGKENGVYTLDNCTFNGIKEQGIYINETTKATYNINNCKFNGDFTCHDGAITIQNNANVNFTVNVTGCEFNNFLGNKIFTLYNNDAMTLNNPDGVEVVCGNR